MTQTQIKQRIQSIDILRGLVMVIMLLDHVRERFFLHHQVSDPMDLDTTSAPLFFSRLAAHLCAPVFVFLTGLSAWLYANPINRAPRDPSPFLLKRGLILILLEATLVNFSWFGAYHTLYLQVIWAIGISMIALALVSALPRVAIFILGVAIVAGHNALSFIEFQPGEWGYSLWTILHDRGYLVEQGLVKIKASYPVLPWIGVILLGYVTGPLFAQNQEPQRRQRRLIQLSFALLALLALLRGGNLYGETLAWQIQADALTTFMDMVNFTKYPPSLDFILLTLGIGFGLMVYFERTQSRLTAILATFGSAPMFFYIAHLYLLLLLYTVFHGLYGANKGQYFGFDHLWQIWLMTAVLAAVLYWPTKAFSHYKHRRRGGWTQYF